MLQQANSAKRIIRQWRRRLIQSGKGFTWQGLYGTTGPHRGSVPVLRAAVVQSGVQKDFKTSPLGSRRHRDRTFLTLDHGTVPGHVGSSQSVGKEQTLYDALKALGDVEMKVVRDGYSVRTPLELYI